MTNLCNPQGFKAEIKALVGDDKNKFFTWFDGGESTEEAFGKGARIFNRLMLTHAKTHLRNLKKIQKCQLESKAYHLSLPLHSLTQH